MRTTQESQELVPDFKKKSASEKIINPVYSKCIRSRVAKRRSEKIGLAISLTFIHLKKKKQGKLEKIR